MYLLALFLVLASLLTVFTGSIASYIDPASLIFLIGISGVLLLASGLWQDFRRALRAAFSKQNIYTPLELKNSVLAVRLTLALLFFTGIFASLMGIVALLAMNEQEKFLPYMSVALLTTLYSWVIILMLLPIQYKLKALIMDEEATHEENHQ